jgi:ATP-dependent DNA helicase PIF1
MERYPQNFIEYPPEFLHEIKESGLPPHELKLKIDCPVMLKRNLNQGSGLCNRTRLRVKVMHRNCIECEFMFGPRTGERVLIPKITVTSAEGKLPFKFY